MNHISRLKVVSCNMHLLLMYVVLHLQAKVARNTRISSKYSLDFLFNTTSREDKLETPLV